MTADVAPTSATTDPGMGLGVEIRLIPGHCDQTVNLYDWYVCVRGNRVEQVWRSPPARGLLTPLAGHEDGRPAPPA